MNHRRKLHGGFGQRQFVFLYLRYREHLVDQSEQMSTLVVHNREIFILDIRFVVQFATLQIADTIMMLDKGDFMS